MIFTRKCIVPDEIRANYHKDFTVISVRIIGIDERHSGKKLSHTISSFKWEVVYLYIKRRPSTRILLDAPSQTIALILK